MSTKENGCARRRHACFPGVRPFSLSPTTSKHLLRRPAKVVADSFHNLVYRAATKTCYEDKLLFRNVYFVATGEKCRKLALKSCIIKSIILPTQHNFEHKTSVSWATRSIICQILLKTEVLTVSKLTKMLVNFRLNQLSNRKHWAGYFSLFQFLRFSWRFKNSTGLGQFTRPWRK